MTSFVAVRQKTLNLIYWIFFRYPAYSCKLPAIRATTASLACTNEAPPCFGKSSQGIIEMNMYS